MDHQQQLMENNQRWVSNRDYSNDEWIYVDLEDTYDISKIVLNWEGDSKHEYKILVSDDQETWQEVIHRTDGIGIQEIKLDELITGRYVKMQGVKLALSMDILYGNLKSMVN